MSKLAEKEGLGKLYEEAKNIDEEAMTKISPNDKKRIIRVLEIYHKTGKTKTEREKESRKKQIKYDYILFAINIEREKLYDRINKRVDIMINSGLVEEVKKLLSLGYNKDLISMQGIGYKEIVKYLEGEYTLDEAIEIIKRDSRRYAKRQITWFKRYKDSKWFDLGNYEDIKILKSDILNYIENITKNV